MRARWVVSGANGYLGGALCRGLHQRGMAVLALARTERGLDPLRAAGVAWATYAQLPAMLSEGDVFVHCAGKTGTVVTWDEVEQVNVNWSAALFEQASRAGAGCFVYISSIAAMGYANRATAVDELDEESPSMLLEGELYGRSKLAAEEQLLRQAKGAGTRLVVLRPGLVYGRRRLSVKSGWIRRGIIVDARQRVPLVHVDSVLDAVVKTADNPAVSGTFIVVDDEQPIIRELIALKIRLGLMHRKPWPVGQFGFRVLCMAQALRRRIRGLPALPPGHLQAQLAAQTRRLRYSTRRLRDATGWQPAVTLEEGLRDNDGAALGSAVGGTDA